MNNSFREIASEIEKAKKIVLYPHLNMDGDALGSCVALCHVFRDRGIDAHVYISEDIPDNLKFLDNGYCTYGKPANETLKKFAETCQ